MYILQINCCTDDNNPIKNLRLKSNVCRNMNCIRSYYWRTSCKNKELNKYWSAADSNIAHICWQHTEYSKTHVHKITNVPVFIWRLDLIILMGANPLLRPLKEVGFKYHNFFGRKWHSLCSLPFQGPKSLIFQGLGYNNSYFVQLGCIGNTFYTSLF
jgi:hypothetical protein